MTDFGLRNKIADIIATDIMDFEVAYDATDAILAMPEISNAQAKIAELENALAAASGTIAAMRADVATVRSDALQEAEDACEIERGEYMVAALPQCALGATECRKAIKALKAKP